QPAQSQSRANLWVMHCIEIRGSSLAWTHKLMPTRSFVVTRTRGRCRRARHVTHRESETAVRGARPKACDELHLVLTPWAARIGRQELDFMATCGGPRRAGCYYTRSAQSRPSLTPGRRPP